MVQEKQQVKVPGFSSASLLGFKTILKNQKMINIKILNKYVKLSADTYKYYETMYESEDSKYTIRVNK